jgi:ABC-type lipoprotein export system ATPase subunit
LFDVPRTEESVVEWHGELPIEDFNWHVGLIVGPSGSGKTTVLREIFGESAQFQWSGASVIDDFPASKSMVEISDACRAVGFNTIPSWLRPFNVLSNGEQFRVDLARRLLETDGAVVLDEFTSIVDRQVAQIASYAVAKYVRQNNRHFVAASCHYDIVDWLQPDWILEMPTMTFTRRSLQRRPELRITICRVPFFAWRIFARFHYLTASLSPVATCFGLYANDRLAAFAGVLHRPISHERYKSGPIWGLSRLVTLPDFQGLGLGPILSDTLGSAYKALYCRFRSYPAHPALIRSFQKSPAWELIRKPGSWASRKSHSASIGLDQEKYRERGGFGGRPCAVFQYCGPAMERDQAERLIRSELCGD